MRGKKAIELSVNFLVIVILSVAILGIGIKLLFDMVKGANELIGGDQCSDEEVNRLLGDNRVVVCPSGLTIPRGKSGGFKIGILNTEADTLFRADMAVSAGANRLNSPFVFSYSKTFTINENSDRKVVANVKVPTDARSGSYSVKIGVCSARDATPANCDVNPYGVQMFYVQVP